MSRSWPSNISEVQQQLGDGVVRTIAMGSTEGLKRGMDVTSTGAAISVPVGKETLGRIMNVLLAYHDRFPTVPNLLTPTKIDIFHRRLNQDID